MVNAFAYGAKDSRFESWVGREFFFYVLVSLVNAIRDVKRG